MRLQSMRMLFGCLAAVALVCVSGCSANHDETHGAGATHTHVKVSKALAREVTNYEDFTGRTAAVESVEVRARVTGYLEKVLFEPGKEVKKDKKLFKIDPRPYKADFDRAEGQVALWKAKMERAIRQFRRAEGLITKGAITPEEFELNTAEKDEAIAGVKAQMANLEGYQLNLGFTDVTSPIDGRVGRNLITEGNLVVADKTLLTTVVSVDPMYAYFDVSERIMLHVQKLIREGKFKAVRQEKDVPVYMALANETGFPHKGTIDFVNTQVDTGTGTLQVRGTFGNPPVPNGDRVLTPGLFVNVRLPIGDPYQAVLISDRAVGMDLGQAFVFVVNEQNKIERRAITTGEMHFGLRVIQSGIKAGERVVVAGLQRLAPDMQVEAETIPMPGFTEPPAEKK